MSLYCRMQFARGVFHSYDTGVMLYGVETFRWADVLSMEFYHISIYKI